MNMDGDCVSVFHETSILYKNMNYNLQIFISCKVQVFNALEIFMWKMVLTERPVGHRSRSANKLSILIDNGKRGSPGEEVKVENTPNHFIRQWVPSVKYIHSITVQQQNSVCISFSTHIPQIHVHRMWPIQIHIQVNRRLIRRPQRVWLVRVEFDPVWLRVLS